MKNILRQLAHMKHSPVQNYICPGLKSSMIGGRAEDGSCVRMFEAARDTREHWITPHSHTFDFTCLVLYGQVANTIYVPSGQQYVGDGACDGEAVYSIGHLHRDEHHVGMGQYQIDRSNDVPVKFRAYTTAYRCGETYCMNHDEVHSVQFHAGAVVLFFEGPHRNRDTVFLEPWVDGFGRVETFKCEPWMFRK